MYSNRTVIMKKSELLARIEALEARVAQLERPRIQDLVLGPRPAYPPDYFTPSGTGDPMPRQPIVTCMPRYNN